VAASITERMVAIYIFNQSMSKMQYIPSIEWIKNYKKEWQDRNQTFISLGEKDKY
jgi:hypothetical protein